MECFRLREIVYDVVNALAQKGDDARVTVPRVTYWVLVAADRLRALHIGKNLSGDSLFIFDDVFVIEQNNFKYVELPNCILDLDNDGGIDFMAKQRPGCAPRPEDFFVRTTYGDGARLGMNPYTTPSPSQPYFYRSKDRLYIMGYENSVGPGPVRLGLYMTLPDWKDIDLDTEIDFPKELILVLRNYTMDMARWGLIIPEERINDGSDTTPNESLAQRGVSPVDPTITRV